tara:strand:+ start:745 stop:1008 length:264 start_codon:yes stop_codon:yes gene_type:complete
MNRNIKPGDLISIWDNHLSATWIDNGVFLRMTKKNIPRLKGTFNDTHHTSEQVEACEVLVRGRKTLYDIQRWIIRKGWHSHDKEKRQ